LLANVPRSCIGVPNATSEKAVPAAGGGTQSAIRYERIGTVVQ